jgi:hypothetical protein
LIAAYEIPRATGDLDYSATLPNDASPLLEKLGVTDLPDDYDSRLTELKLGLKHLRLLALDPYDLILSKLTRNSPQGRRRHQSSSRTQHVEFSVLYDRFEQEIKP